MSVLQRFRKTSEFQPVTDARTIRAMVMNWALNENNIPKRKRVLFLNDLKDITRNLVLHTKDAHYVFPRDAETVNERKRLLKLAMKDCQDLWDELTFIDDVQALSNPLNLDKLEPILTLLYKETNALKSWKDNTKVNTTQK